MGLPESIEAARLSTTHFHASFFNHMDSPGVIQVENRIGPEVQAELKARRHVVKETTAFGMSTGIVLVAIRPDTGTLIGAADPRR